MVSALILFMVIGLLPVFVREFRNNARLMLAYWFVIALHQGVAFTNAFLFITLGADKDARTFHAAGVALAHSKGFYLSVTAKLYENILGVVYWLFGPSQLLGSQLSILMFAVSCIVLNKILGLLELSRYRVSTLLAFGALPSIVFFGSITLRESYQVLFFMLATYWGIKMHMKESIRVYGVFMVLSALAMGLLHNGLWVYGIFLIMLFMLWTPHVTSNWLSIKKRHLIVVLVVLVFLTGIIFLIKVQHVNLGLLSSFNWDLLEQAASFQARSKSVVSRATYDIDLDISSPFATAYTSFLLYMTYLFAPFPWQINSILDVGASIESILRMVLIYFSVKHWRQAHGVQRRLLWLMLILFFSMSFMWALGTTNYGTAIRHNMLSWWILAIAGVPMLMKILSRFRLG
jgi:hypothetical protein